MPQQNKNFYYSNSLKQPRYRFGYNGMEKVNEWVGIGNHNTAKFWEYDTRTGRRLNLDPVINYSLSPYGTFDLSPIWKNDVQGDDPTKRAYKYARKHGLKDEDFSYETASNGKDVYLNWGSTLSNGEPNKSSKIFKYNLIDRIGDVLGAGDRWADRKASKAIYKATRLNPFVQGVTSLWSSVLGRDVSMKDFDNIPKTGDHVSGDHLSGTQRAIEGGKAVSNFVGFGLGGGSGFLTDLGVNGAANWADNKTNGKAGIGVKTSASIIQFYREIRTNPMKATLETTNSLFGITLDEASKHVQNEKKIKK